MRLKTFITLLSVVLAISCESAITPEIEKDPQTSKETQVKISSEEVSGVWRWYKYPVFIENGEIHKDQSYGNSPADPEENNSSYLEFENGKVLAHYTHYVFYEYTDGKNGVVWGEYVIDNNVNDLLISFDKETKKGTFKNLSGLSGELTVLKSNNDSIELLLDLGNDSYSVLELNHEANTDLIQKLKTCPNRDYNQMRLDRDEYWKQKN